MTGINPYPFVGLNHFTVPLANVTSNVAPQRYQAGSGRQKGEAQRVWPDRGHTRICALSHGTNFRPAACPIRGAPFAWCPDVSRSPSIRTLCFAARNGTGWMGPQRAISNPQRVTAHPAYACREVRRIRRLYVVTQASADPLRNDL